MTGGAEHFDTPGIRAARLEKAAAPGQILCTDIIRELFVPHYPQLFSQTSRKIRTKDRRLTAFEVLPFDTAKLQNLFSDIIFRKPAPRSEETSARSTILIVDDEVQILELFSDLLKDELQGYNIITAHSAEEALTHFRPGQCALVILDQNMSGMCGTELFQHMVFRDPELSALMVTGQHGVELAQTFLSLGGSYFMMKPASLYEVLEAVDITLLNKIPRLTQTDLEILADDRGKLLWLMQEVSRELHLILGQVNDQRDIAHSLLRHKAKQLVRDFVNTLQPGANVVESLSIVKVQLDCVARLSNFVGRLKIGEVQSYLATVVSDLHRLNPLVQIALTYSHTEENFHAVTSGAVMILVVCELIDNAIAALKRSGEIEIAISFLASTNSLQIISRDNGPGIADDITNRMFDAGISTKGSGRGLGLCLVREAVERLNGQISYEYDGGALFRIVFPLN